MQSKELCEKLRSYANGSFVGKKGQESPKWKGQRSFALYLAYYLENMVDLSSSEKFDFWSIEPYLPQICTDAFEQLRTGTDTITELARKKYLAETGHEVPNIVDLGASDLLHQSSAVQTTIGFMLKDIFGEHGELIAQEVGKYCNAQKYVLQQTFDKFLRLVYREGLYVLIEKSSERGMNGVFGKTELRTFSMAGRIMLTFAQSSKPKRERYVKNDDGSITSHEISVSFVAEERDPLAYRAGLQSIFADFKSALNMIEEVIENWPKEERKQKMMFKASKTVSIF